jgi:hypothetical protein
MFELSGDRIVLRAKLREVTIGRSQIERIRVAMKAVGLTKTLDVAADLRNATRVFLTPRSVNAVDLQNAVLGWWQSRPDDLPRLKPPQ